MVCCIGVGQMVQGVSKLIFIVAFIMAFDPCGSDFGFQLRYNIFYLHHDVIFICVKIYHLYLANREL